MKIFNKIFYSIMIGSLLMTSCVSLDEEVTKVTITLDDYYQDEGQAKGGLYGIYSSMRDYFKNHFIVMSTEGTLGVWGNRMQNYDYNPTHQYLFNNWRDGYRVIYNVNVFLEKIQDIEMDEVIKNQYMAEAKFMRGLIYFNLTQFFGAVPLSLDTTLDYEASLLPNGERNMESKLAHIELVYNQILEDMQFAEQNLPASHDAENISRATSGAAKGLLAKIYLTMAGWPLNKGASHYALAKDYASQVIESGTYRLLDDYSQIFVASNENNAEIIFNVEYVSLLDQGADWGGWHNDRGVDFDGGYGRIRLQPSFYSQLENGDALIPSNAHFEAEDPRRAFVAVDWDPNKGLVYNNREQIDLNKIGTWKFRHESTPLLETKQILTVLF